MEELQGTARLQIALAKMDGYTVDKKLMRFNDIVQEALDWANMGEVFRPSIARKSIYETVCRCIPCDVGYAGKRYNKEDYSWAVY